VKIISWDLWTLQQVWERAKEVSPSILKWAFFGIEIPKCLESGDKSVNLVEINLLYTLKRF
jgi:hypothetical protein